MSVFKLFVLTMLLCVSTWGAESAQSPTVIPQVDGVWQDAPAATIQDAYMIISQTGDQLKMVHHLRWNGKPFVEEGQGTIDASGKITWKVIVTTQIPGWATAGTHTLKYDADKGTLKGEYHDNKDNKGPLVFHRLKATSLKQ